MNKLSHNQYTDPIPELSTHRSRTGTLSQMLIDLVRKRSNGDPVSVYKRGWINRRTWSSIISNPERPVSKRTILQLGLSLRLKRNEMDTLLTSSGFSLSPVIPEDIVFTYCIEHGIFDLFKVNDLLYRYSLKVLTPP